jgi:hypothetical protein
VASRDRHPISREEAETAYARLLLQRVRQDKYPSANHMLMLEQTLPPALTREYLSVLFEKTQNESHPSIPMLQRIQRIVQRL